MRPNKDLLDLLDKYGVQNLEDLESRLKHYQLLIDRHLSFVDTQSYNMMLRDYNRYLVTERNLGADLIGFIQEFIKGDALWAYNTERKIIGEIKLKDPFAHEIRIRKLEDDELEDSFEVYDKTKLN